MELPKATPERQYAFGTTPVEVDPSAIQSERTISADELVEIGEEILRRANTSGRSPEDHAATDALMRELWEEYADFAKEFPLVIRWAVQRREYDPRAFRLYLEKVHKPFYKKRETFLKAQAEYLVMMYIRANRKVPRGAVEGYRKAVVKRVLEDDETFMEAVDESKTELSRRSEAQKASARAALVAEAAAARGAAPE